MADRSAITSSKKDESIVRLKEMLLKAEKMRDAGDIIKCICHSFWTWHCPSVTCGGLDEEVAIMVQEFFGIWATREHDIVTVYGLFTEDDESP